MSVTLGDTSSELEKLKAQVKQAPQVVNSKTALSFKSRYIQDHPTVGNLLPSLIIFLLKS